MKTIFFTIKKKTLSNFAIISKNKTHLKLKFWFYYFQKLNLTNYHDRPFAQAERCSIPSLLSVLVLEKY